MSFKILVLEDDLLFGETLQDFLEDADCSVTYCRNGEEALEATYSNRFDLYLLDINVPLIDGVTLLGELRGANDTTAAIYLTSHTDKETLSRAFKNGADDYLKKPFDMDELMLRIYALMRRTKGESKICIKELCIDDKHKRVSYKNSEIRLAAKEYQLLKLFMNNAGEVVTKEMILEALWNSSESVSDGAIRVYINRLKQELDAFSIENIRAVGYRFVP
ncbi:MAG: response regulator transcription factor [Campylobacterota bacterium]|nr:response regulator transcription factor [Campylobacterota bacterium]